MTPAMRQECRQLCQKWVRLVGETILAEFPSYDILGSFHVFNLDPKARRDASDCLVQDSAATALARLAKHCNVDPAALTAELEDHRPIALQTGSRMQDGQLQCLEGSNCTFTVSENCEAKSPLPIFEGSAHLLRGAAVVFNKRSRAIVFPRSRTTSLMIGLTCWPSTSSLR